LSIEVYIYSDSFKYDFVGVFIIRSSLVMKLTDVYNDGNICLDSSLLLRVH